MSAIEVPSIKDIHRIAYLTMHGWELNYRGAWEKPGVLRELNDEEIRENRRRPNANRPEDWELEDAYWHQKDLSDLGHTKTITMV